MTARLGLEPIQELLHVPMSVRRNSLTSASVHALLQMQNLFLQVIQRRLPGLRFVHLSSQFRDGNRVSTITAVGKRASNPDGAKGPKIVRVGQNLRFEGTWFRRYRVPMSTNTVGYLGDLPLTDFEFQKDGLGFVGPPCCMVIDVALILSAPADIVKKRGHLNSFSVRLLRLGEVLGRLRDPLDVRPIVGGTDVVEIPDRDCFDHLNSVCHILYWDSMRIPSGDAWYPDNSHSEHASEISIDVIRLPRANKAQQSIES